MEPRSQTREEVSTHGAQVVYKTRPLPSKPSHRFVCPGRNQERFFRTEVVGLEGQTFTLSANSSCTSDSNYALDFIWELFYFFLEKRWCTKDKCLGWEAHMNKCEYSSMECLEVPSPTVLFSIFGVVFGEAMTRTSVKTQIQGETWLQTCSFGSINVCCIASHP